jgi:hypothetical protein
MDWDLSKYKDIFGKPNSGVHKYRFFGIAIVDVAETILAAWIISYYSGYSFVYTLGFLFILGIIVHRLFSVRTTIDKLVFPNN